jgi:hypothetical protein
VKFQKGTSGNPAGRARGFERLARERWAVLAGGSDEDRVDEYIMFLREIMLSQSEETRDRLAAAKLLKETCDGKPRESIDLNTEPSLSEDEYTATLARIVREQVAAMPLEERMKLLTDPASSPTIQ